MVVACRSGDALSEVSRRVLLRLAGCVASLPLILGTANADSFTTLYDFSVQADNNPIGLALGPAGTLYGTTASGGPDFGGAIYELVEPKSGKGLWSRPLLYSFTGETDGGIACASPVLGKSGLLYGTADRGGAYSYGVAYQIDPLIGAKSYKVIWAFTGGDDGDFPCASVAVDANGAVYATTEMGGTGGGGTLVKLTPPAKASGAWTATTLHAFTAAKDGGTLWSGVLIGATGTLYGNAYYGGRYNAGTAYSVTPPAAGAKAWTFKVLHTFTGGSDGGNPEADFVVDKLGVLYGTAVTGGKAGGTVYRLTPPVSPAKAWSFKVLHSFPTFSQKDGDTPRSSVALDKDGALFGTTIAGGATYGGTLFKLTPPKSGAGSWAFSLLYSFPSDFVYPSDPNGRLEFDATGALYGATQGGGTLNGGTIFRYVP